MAGRLSSIALQRGFLIAMVAFLIAPLVAVVYVSFSPVVYFQFPPHGASLQWFGNLSRNPVLLESLVRSLLLAFLVVIVTGILATAAALGMDASSFPGKGALDALFQAPLVMPELIFGLALIQVFAPLKLTDTITGLLLAHLAIAFPYFIRSVYVSLAGRDRAQEEAAATLGASPLRVFATVTLPAIRGGMVAGAIFAYIASFDQFTVSVFLVGTRTMTLPVAIYNYLFQNSDPTVAAISTIVIAIGLISAALANRTIGLDRLLLSERPAGRGA